VYKRLETRLAVQRWDLLRMDAPDGTRDPIVLHSDDGARAVLIVLQAGQSLGDHQVKENAWVTVLDGTVQITGDGETVEGGPGTLARFDPDEKGRDRFLILNSGQISRTRETLVQLVTEPPNCVQSIK